MSVGVDSGAAVVLGLLAFVLSAAVYVWVALALSATFRKMGEEPWRAWVPFLNVATILRWGGFNPWFVLFALIPGLGPVAVWVLTVIAVNRINPGFGYGTGLTVLAAFLFPVWATIVGFGPAQWRGARPARAVPASTPGHAPGASNVLPPLPPPGLPAASAGRPSVFAEPAPASSEERAPMDAAASPASMAPQPWAPPPAPAERPISSAPSIPPPAAAPSADEERPDPTAPTPTVRPESAWQTDMDEVSAVSPAPFPPNAASGTRPYVSPPVSAGESGIISAVPGREGHDAPVTRLRPPVAPSDREDRDVFPELTGEVSAVVGSPAAGAPVSATSSVSAQERERDERAAASPPSDLGEDDLDRTIIVRRGRVRWELVPPAGTPVPLTADVVIVGRNPAADPSRPQAQLVPIADATRTVSKTHARLERRGDAWHITDLDSTNGVLLPSLLGTDIEVEPGTDAELSERFLLGDASLRIQRVEPGA